MSSSSQSEIRWRGGGGGALCHPFSSAQQRKLWASIGLGHHDKAMWYDTTVESRLTCPTLHLQSHLLCICGNIERKHWILPTLVPWHLSGTSFYPCCLLCGRGLQSGIVTMNNTLPSTLNCDLYGERHGPEAKVEALPKGRPTLNCLYSPIDTGNRLSPGLRPFKKKGIVGKEGIVCFYEYCLKSIMY